MKNYIKSIYYFFCLAAWVLGTVGGFGWAAFNKAWLIALAVLALGAMAFPYVRKCFQHLKNGD